MELIKEAIKKGAMQQLLTGKKRLPGFDGEWGVKKLGELCSDINDGTHYTPKYVDRGVPFYSVENVVADNFSDVKYITPEEHKSLIRRCKPEKGDILLTRIGTLGITKLIDWDVDASIYVSLALLKSNDKIRAEYLYAYTKSVKFVEDLKKRSLTNATPQKINMGEISGIPIHLPNNFEEQLAIGNVLLDMESEIQVLRQKREKTGQIKQGMMQELLTGRARLV
ncbi:MAG: hypothetical protein GVY20_08725 [Bacteroidetes bacterium]|jgi:type I restriction enzyme S subunit|nr:hypothetical protein [Bacteroidota bacterium]